VGEQKELTDSKVFYRSAARTFFHRGMAGVDALGPAEPRPKRYWVKDLEWGISVHIAFMVCTGTGFERFDVAPLFDQQASPYIWPGLSIAPDQRSDGFAFRSSLRQGAFAPVRYKVEVCFLHFKRMRQLLL
jgi:hypothetical protein